MPPTAHGVTLSYIKGSSQKYHLAQNKVTKTNGDPILKLQLDGTEPSFVHINGLDLKTHSSKSDKGTYSFHYRAKDNDGWSSWVTIHLVIHGTPPHVDIPDFTYHAGDPALNINIASYTTRTEADSIMSYAWLGGELPTGLDWSGGQSNPPTSVMYENSEDGSTSRWRVYSGHGAITNVFDNDKQSRVINLSGSNTSSGYRLRTSSNSDWHDTNHHIISWDMKYSQNYVVYIATRTSKGFRYIYYTNSNSNGGGTSTYVHHGLGNLGLKDGTWHTVVRDLDADLKEFQPDNTITRVDAFLIRGTGRVDDIKLLSNPHLAAHGAFTGSPTQSGTYFITGGAKDTDGIGVSTFKLTVVVPEPPVTHDKFMPTKYLNESFSYNILSNGGVTRTDGDPILAYQYQGTIPGVTLNTSTGVVSGAGTVPGLHTIKFRAKDKDGWSNWSTLKIVIVNVDGNSDLCYNDIGYNSMMMCRPDPDHGDFRGGPGCQQFIPLTNTGSSKLTHVKITLDQTPSNDISMSACKTQESGSWHNCTNKNVHHYHWAQYDYNLGVEYDLADVQPDANVTLGYGTSMMGLPMDTRAMMDGTNLYVKYTTTSGTVHIAKVPSCGGLTDSDSQVDGNFTLIFGGAGTATLGDMVATGDSILYVTDPADTDNYSGSLVDANTSYMLSDASFTGYTTDTRKHNSSRTKLKLPSYVKAKHIKWAGLFWQGYVHNDKNDPLPAGETVNSVKSRVDGWNKVRIKTPDGSVHAIEADKNVKDVNNTAYYYMMVDHDSYRFFYGAYKNITDLVKTTFDDNGTHEYTVGNIMTTHGKDYRDALYIAHANNNAGKWYTDSNGGGISIGYFGGWSLVVVYDLLGTDEATTNGASEAYKNVSIYNGYDFFMTWGDGDVDFTADIALSGFKTPGSGTVDSKLLFFGGGGDKSLALDILQMQNKKTTTFADISDGSNPSNNQFNSTHVIMGHQLNPAKPNHQGMDLDIFDVSSHMGHKQTQTKIRFGTKKKGTDPLDPSLGDGDQVFPQVLGFSTKLYTPKLCYDFDVRVGKYYKVEIGDDRNFTISSTGTDPLIFHIMLKNEQADFDLQHSRAQIAFNGSPALSFDLAHSSYSPPSTNAYLPAIDTNDSEDFIAIGENATNQGGTIGSSEINYAKYVYRFNNSNTINDIFDIQIRGQIQFAPGLSAIPYELTSAGDANSSTHIARCEGDKTYAPVYGWFNVERGNATTGMPPKTRYPLYTQVTGRDYEVSLVSYGNPPAYDTEQASSTTVELELIHADTFENNSSTGFDSVCQNHDPDMIVGEGSLFYFNGRKRIPGISMNSDMPGYLNQTALRNAAFRVWVFVKTDSNGTKSIVNFNETDKTDFKHIYDSYFKADDLNGSRYCVSDCSTSGTTTCYECVKEYFATPICSRDNFAIRPEGFRVKVSDQGDIDGNTSAPSHFIADNDGVASAVPIAAGYHYLLEAQARRFGDSGIAKGYYATFDNNDTHVSDTAVAAFGGTSTMHCADTSGHAQFINLSHGSTAFSPATLKIDNAGPYNYWMTDVNWTNVDQASYPYKTTFDNACKTNPGGNGCNDCTTDSESIPAHGMVGCQTSSDISGNSAYESVKLKLQPYKFTVSAVPTFKPDVNTVDVNGTVTRYLFMNDFNHSDFNPPSGDTIDMAAIYKGTISAVGKDGVILTNFTDTCAASDIELNVTTQDNSYPETYAMQFYLQEGDDMQPFVDTSVSDKTNNPPIVLPKKAFHDNLNQGIATILLNTTVQKTYRASITDTNSSKFEGINPVRITYRDLNASDSNASSNANMRSAYIPWGDNNTTASVVYLHGKVTPGKLYYRDVTDISKQTALYVDVYCNPNQYPAAYPNNLRECRKQYLASTTYGADEDKIKWHPASMFDAFQIGRVNLQAIDIGSLVNGNPRLTVGGAGPAATINNVLFDTPSQAMQQDINVSITGGVPSIIRVNYRPKPWLVYDKDKDFYRVNFIGTGTWNGIGKTGGFSETRSGKPSRPRMNW